MTPERWQRLHAAFDAALQQGPVEQDRFLRQTCADDPTLIDEVRQLLAHDAGAGRDDFLAAPPPLYLRTTGAADDGDALLGQRLGPYQITARIASGGMGSVYRAARVDDYRQEVAIKLIKRGFDCDEFRRRFRTERQVLASLQHPHVTRLLDGGTTADGLPYLVMEHIDGQPIDKYCDERRLPPRPRLRLFLDVCAAVQHAHQHAVIHRDLKPGNILVTADGVVKLVDFGIAKLTEPDADGPRTGTDDRLLTPHYASPEQVRGEPLTTASDLYSLGVVLYELLTGRRPYRLTSHLRHEIERAVCEEEPEKPSTVVGRPAELRHADGAKTVRTPEEISQARAGDPRQLRRQLAGDLDSIVLMALSKDPSARYASAEALADDLRRYLDDRPVQARTASAWERGLKWVRRRPATAALTAVSALALAAAVVANGLYIDLLQRQRNLAQERERLAGELRDQAERQRSSRASQALSYHNQGVFNREHGQKPDGPIRAETYFREAIRIGEELVRDHPDLPSFRQALAMSRINLADLYHATGRPDEAQKAYLQAVADAEQLVRDSPDVPEYQKRLASTYTVRVAWYRKAGRLTDPDPQVLNKAASAWERVIQLSPDDPEAHNEQASAYYDLGAYYRDAKQLPRMEAMWAKSAALSERLVRDHPGVYHYADNLGRMYYNLGVYAVKNDDFAKGADWSTKAIGTLGPLHRQKPKDARVTWFLGHAYHNRAHTLYERGHYREALGDWDRALAVGPEAERPAFRLGRCGCLAQLGEYEKAAREAAEATGAAAQDGPTLFDRACVLAVAARAARSDMALSSAERARRFEKYAADAVGLLAKAKALDYFREPEQRGWLEKEKDLQPLRDRPDFKKLLE